MGLKELWSKTSSWLKAHRPSIGMNQQAELNNEGLISQEPQPTEGGVEEAQPLGAESSQVVVKTVPPKDKRESLEKLQAGFDKLVEQLKGINEHLNRQVTQHQELMSRIEQLPKFFGSFPAMMEAQKQITEQLLEQLKSASGKNQQFVEAVEKIPMETAKQTDALVDINHQLAAAADIDVQMAESFNKFNQALERLSQNTVNQADSIHQMSRTFATSDRYLKYIISRQNKRFMWIFIMAIGVCVLVVLILIGIIIYVKS